MEDATYTFIEYVINTYKKSSISKAPQVIKITDKLLQG